MANIDIDIKETVSVISSDSPSKYVKYSLLKALSGQVVIIYQNFIRLKTDSFSIVFS